MTHGSGVGLIGYSIGKVHTHSWLNVRRFYPDIIKSQPKLVAVCGRKESAIRSFVDRYGYERSYGDWRDLVKDPDVDILDNCAPPNLHLEPCIAAAEAGKAVLCEKPLARSSDEAYQMYRAVSKTSQVHMAGFNKRFLPATLYARDLVKSGRLGNITHVVATFYNIETGQGYSDPSYPLTWNFRKEIAGHGSLYDLGSHLIDLLRFIAGDIVSVCGAKQTFVDERPMSDDKSRMGKVDVEDSIVGCLRFQEGAIGTISVSWMPRSIKDYLTLEVYGTDGGFKFSFERPTELQLYINNGSDYASNGYRTVYCTGKEHPMMARFWPDQGSSYGFEESFVSEIAHFLSCVENGDQVGPIGASFYDGYVTALISDELLASSDDGKWHNVNPRSV